MSDTPRTDAHYARCKDYARKAAFQNRWEGGAQPAPAQRKATPDAKPANPDEDLPFAPSHRGALSAIA